LINGYDDTVQQLPGVARPLTHIFDVNTSTNNVHKIKNLDLNGTEVHFPVPISSNQALEFEAYFPESADVVKVCSSSNENRSVARSGIRGASVVTALGQAATEKNSFDLLLQVSGVRFNDQNAVVVNPIVSPGVPLYNPPRSSQDVEFKHLVTRTYKSNICTLVLGICDINELNQRLTVALPPHLDLMRRVYITASEMTFFQHALIPLGVGPAGAPRISSGDDNIRMSSNSRTFIAEVNKIGAGYSLCGVIASGGMLRYQLNVPTSKPAAMIAALTTCLFPPIYASNSNNYVNGILMALTSQPCYLRAFNDANGQPSADGAGNAVVVRTPFVPPVGTTMVAYIAALPQGTFVAALNRVLPNLVATAALEIAGYYIHSLSIPLINIQGVDVPDVEAHIALFSRFLTEYPRSDFQYVQSAFSTSHLLEYQSNLVRDVLRTRSSYTTLVEVPVVNDAMRNPITSSVLDEVDSLATRPITITLTGQLQLRGEIVHDAITPGRIILGKRSAYVMIERLIDLLVDTCTVIGVLNNCAPSDDINEIFTTVPGGKVGLGFEHGQTAGDMYRIAYDIAIKHQPTVPDDVLKALSPTVTDGIPYSLVRHLLDRQAVRTYINRIRLCIARPLIFNRNDFAASGALDPANVGSYQVTTQASYHSNTSTLRRLRDGTGDFGRIFESDVTVYDPITHAAVGSHPRDRFIPRLSQETIDKFSLATRSPNVDRLLNSSSASLSGITLSHFGHFGSCIGDSIQAQPAGSVPIISVRDMIMSFIHHPAAVFAVSQHRNAVGVFTLPAWKWCRHRIRQRSVYADALEHMASKYAVLELTFHYDVLKSLIRQGYEKVPDFLSEGTVMLSDPRRMQIPFSGVPECRTIRAHGSSFMNVPVRALFDPDHSMSRISLDRAPIEGDLKWVLKDARHSVYQFSRNVLEISNLNVDAANAYPSSLESGIGVPNDTEFLEYPDHEPDPIGITMDSVSDCWLLRSTPLPPDATARPIGFPTSVRYRRVHPQPPAVAPGHDHDVINTDNRYAPFDYTFDFAAPIPNVPPAPAIVNMYPNQGVNWIPANGGPIICGRVLSRYLHGGRPHRAPGMLGYTRDQTEAYILHEYRGGSWVPLTISEYLRRLQMLTGSIVDLNLSTPFPDARLILNAPNYGVVNGAGVVNRDVHMSESLVTDKFLEAITGNSICPRIVTFTHPTFSSMSTRYTPYINSTSGNVSTLKLSDWKVAKRSPDVLPLVNTILTEPNANMSTSLTSGGMLVGTSLKNTPMPSSNFKAIGIDIAMHRVHAPMEQTPAELESEETGKPLVSVVPANPADDIIN
jgi:hypothetical protein